MSLKILFNLNKSILIRLQNSLSRRSLASSTTPKDTTIIDEKSIYETAEETPIFASEIEDSEEIERVTNKSRLRPQHRRMFYGQIPYDEPIEWYHRTVKYKKRMLGRYGMQAVGVPAGFAWPTREEVEDMKEYERVAYPHSIQEEWAKIKEKNENEAAAIKAREAEISANMLKMDKWIADMNARIAKKEAEMLQAKKLRERLIEEVRHELGVTVPVYDDKFKEALVLKEKAVKKKQKEERKKLKLDKMSKSNNSVKVDEDVTPPSVDEPVK